MIDGFCDIECRCLRLLHPVPRTPAVLRFRSPQKSWRLSNFCAVNNAVLQRPHPLFRFFLRQCDDARRRTAPGHGPATTIALMVTRAPPPAWRWRPVCSINRFQPDAPPLLAEDFGVDLLSHEDAEGWLLERAARCQGDWGAERSQTLSERHWSSSNSTGVNKRSHR